MRDVVGIAVMLNNFLHDLSAAMFFCSLLVLESVRQAPVAPGCAAALERRFKRVAIWSFVFIVLFGAVRVLAYKDFEWYSAVQHGQVAALVVKHVLFIAIIAAALWRLRGFRRVDPPDHGAE